MGIIATRSFDEQVTGLRDLRDEHVDRIRNGMYAYELLEKLRAGDKSEVNMAAFDEVKGDLGYGLLLKRYTENVVDATEEQINRLQMTQFQLYGRCLALSESWLAVGLSCCLFCCIIHPDMSSEDRAETSDS